jgi:thioredoxin
MAVEVTEETFDREVGASAVAVVVEFYATWCGNCRRVAPVLEVLGAEFIETVKFVTVNAEQCPALVARFGVSATPTLFVLDRGRQVASVVGAQPAAVLRALFDLAAGRVAAGRVEQARSELAWVTTDACTLPSSDRPARLAEFEGLFESLRGLRRPDPRWLRLRLDDAEVVEQRARDLTAREASCCPFFTFEVHREPGELVVDVRVSEDRVMVLDGLTAQAQAVVHAGRA